MKERILLSTIQKREKLNDIYAIGEKGPGGAYHGYSVRYTDDRIGLTSEHVFIFQKGARKENDSQCGVIDTDLLEIVRHRLKCFQDGEYATKENEMALQHLEECLMWLNRRVEDRIERSVLGTYNK